MTKRIVSGVFILMALGALGIILAGAITSGEQLIVRFLTAVIVGALGLYVVSDLRLQADDDSAAIDSSSTQMAMADTPPNSTAAFMATVTRRENIGDLLSSQALAEAGAIAEASSISSTTEAEDARAKLLDKVLGTAPSSTTEQASAVVEGAGSPPPKEADTGVRSSKNSPVEFPTAQNPVSPAPETTPVAAIAEMKAPARPGAKAQPAAKTEVKGQPVQADEFAWPTPPAPPQPKSDDLATQPVSERSPAKPSAPKPDGYRVELTPTPAETQAAPQNPLNGSPHTNGVYAPKESHVKFNRIEASLAGEPTPPMPVAPLERSSLVSAASYADADLAPIIDLRDSVSIESDIENAISQGEIEVVSTLIEQGMLSTEGTISDRDVRTMVYVAFTSNELRKLLRAGGQPGTANAPVDLGPVELFDPLKHRPTPTSVYRGPSQPELPVELPTAEPSAHPVEPVPVHSQLG